MNETLDPPPVLTEVCPKCCSLYRYRRDQSGNLIREICGCSKGASAKPEPRRVSNNLIAFTGLAQAGKTTCARWLRDCFGFSILSFATPLKRMLSTLVDVNDKDGTPFVLGGRTVRHAMQTLGTEWGRNLICDDIWLRAATRQVQDLKSAGFERITFDDVRFSNEAALVREMGGIVIWLGRPGLAAMDHVSESGIDPALVDHRITAETSESLIERLDGILSRA